MKIGILIPTTTFKTKFKKLEDTFLFKICLPSLLNTINNQHTYELYLAIDDNDKVYSKLQNHKKLLNKNTYKNINKNIKLTPHILSTKKIEKGNVVGYWNMCYEKAYNDNCEYFVQCGDDIIFYDKNWLDQCIHHLKLNMDYGVSTPVDIRNKDLMTQSVVSRKHYELFGYYYPPELKSWFCDNYITDLYKDSLGTFVRARLENKGGDPRYTPPDWESTKQLCAKLVEKDMKVLQNHINNQVCLHLTDTE